MRIPAVQRARDTLPHCLGVALFDLSDGSVMSEHIDAQLPLTHTRTAAVAMRDLFKRPAEDDQVHEVVVGSPDRLHIGLRSRTHAGLAVLFVCHAAINVGMVLARAKLCLLEIEESI